MKDYYHDLDVAIKTYEEHKPYHPLKTSEISDKIAWCWKWKKITNEQLDDLTSRMIKVFQEGM